MAKNIAEQLQYIDEQHDALDIDSEASDDDVQEDDTKAVDEEDTFHSELAPSKTSGNPSQNYRRNRRISVSSESIDPIRLKEQLMQLKIIPKSDETLQALFQVVSKSPMLRRMLGPEERALIVKAFAGPEIKQPDEVIIQQGDEGDTFYLVESGTVNVYVKKILDDNVHVHTYHAGDTFGQLALMYNTPRAATCRAETEVKLWTLDRTAFKAIIVGASLRKREMYSAFLAQVPILHPLKEVERLTLSDALTEEKFEDGAIVCEEGQPGDEFFLILDGNADCYVRNNRTDSSKLLSTLSRGQYFGEIALLTDKPRQATVVAKGTLKVLIVDRATFTRVFGPMEEILQRNIDLYNRFTKQ
jgi:cAMP-dependent protein kinase regulator